MSDAPNNVQVKTQWAINLGAVPSMANQFMLQPGPPSESGVVDGFYLIFGHVNPPMIPGEPGQPITQEMADSVVLPVSEIARVFVTKDRLRDIQGAIAAALNAG